MRRVLTAFIRLEHPPLLRLGLCFLASLFLAIPAFAQLDVDEQIELEKQDVEPRGYHFGRGWLDRALGGYDQFQASRDSLDYYFYVSPMYQFADGLHGADQQFNYSVGTFFNWKPIRTESHQGALRLWLDFSEITHGPATKPYSHGLGLQQLTNDNGAKTSKGKIGQLYWDSKLYNGKLDLAVGHMDPYLQFADNPYAYWDRKTSIAQALSSDVVSPWGDAGLGVIGTVKLPGDFYFKLGTLDSDGDGRYPDFSSLSKGHWQHTVEVGRVGQLGGQPSVIRLAYSDAPRKGEFKGGTGWALSLAQDLSDRVALWARLTDAPRPRQDFRRQYGGGLVLKDPFGFRSDQISFSAMRTVATDKVLRDETAIEFLWRFQLTARLAFSPAVTVYLDPARDEAASELVVGTIRFFVKI